MITILVEIFIFFTYRCACCHLAMEISNKSSKASVARSQKAAKHKSSKIKKGKQERRNIVYLTSILRLRCKPAVPYHDIAYILLVNFYDQMVYLVLLVTKREFTGAGSKKGFTRTNTSDLRRWLTEYGKYFM